MKEIKQPYRSVIRGNIIRTTGQVVMILIPVTWCMSLLDRWVAYVSEDEFLIFSTLAFAVLLLMPKLIKYGKRIATRDALDMLKLDPRPPVVFLRPFNEDDKSRTQHDLDDSRDLGEFGNMTVLRRLRAFRIFVQGFLGVDDLTLEQEFDYALSDIGPMVAIGKPGEATATAGAYRFYVDDLHWKDAIHKVLDKASVVVWHAGMTEGTWWELETIIKEIDPRRLIMIVPSPRYRLSAYRALRERFINLLPVALPDTAEDFNLVIFDKSWKPEFLQYKIHEGLAKYFRVNGLDLQATLKPFTQRLENFNKENQQAANYPSRRKIEFKANMVSIFVAIVCSISVYYAGDTFKNFTDLKNKALQDCNEYLASMSYMIDVSTTDGIYPYPARWVEYVKHFRSFFAVEDNAACLKVDRKVMLSKFEDAVRNPPRVIVSSWMTLAKQASVPVTDVTEAIQLTGNSTLIEEWDKEKARIDDARHTKVIVLDVKVNYEDKNSKSELLDTTERDITFLSTNSVMDFFKKLIPAPYVVRLASRLPENEYANQYVHRINVSLRIELAAYKWGESGLSNVSLPDILLPAKMSASINLTGKTLFQGGVVTVNNIRIELPKNTSITQMDSQTESLTTSLVAKLFTNISPQKIGCETCVAIEKQ